MKNRSNFGSRFFTPGQPSSFLFFVQMAVSLDDMKAQMAALHLVRASHVEGLRVVNASIFTLGAAITKRHKVAFAASLDPATTSDEESEEEEEDAKKKKKKKKKKDEEDMKKDVERKDEEDDKKKKEVKKKEGEKEGENEAVDKEGEKGEEAAEKEGEKVEGDKKKKGKKAAVKRMVKVDEVDLAAADFERVSCLKDLPRSACGGCFRSCHPLTGPPRGHNRLRGYCLVWAIPAVVGRPMGTLKRKAA
jgi:hypothetical protein